MENNSSLIIHHSPVLGPPPPYQVWGYGLLLVTGINLCSLLGVAVNPLSKKHWYSTLLLFMVSVAVGVLAGSSLLFLLAGALEVDMTDVGIRNNYINKITIALSTVFVFFNFEQLLKLLLAKLVARRKAKYAQQTTVNPACECKKALTPTNSGANHQLAIRNNSARHTANNSDSFATAPMLLNSTCSCGGDNELSRTNDISMNALPISSIAHHHPNTRVSAVAGVSLGLTGAATIPPPSLTPDAVGDNEVFAPALSTEPPAKSAVQRSESVVSGVAVKSLSEVQPVAWMVICGDGIHNFVDGLSIGAGMARSFPTGLSIALAVLAEELPHELGDLAVLLRAGLPLKKALAFNFLSACLCYAGFVIGAIVGELPQANAVIYAIAAGLFLYIALTDLLPELSPDSSPEGSDAHGHSHHADHRRTEQTLSASADQQPLGGAKSLSVAHLCSHLAIADTGMLLGYGMILLLAYYSEDIRISMESASAQSLVDYSVTTTVIPT